MSLRSIVARFYIASIEKFSYQGASPSNPAPGWAAPAPVIKVKMNVVTGGRTEANKQWASSTPSGHIEMTVGNPAAAAWLTEMQDAGYDIAVTFEARPPEELA